MGDLVLGTGYENWLKMKEKFYFMKLTSKRVISTKNPVFGPKIINSEILTKKKYLGKAYENYSKIKKKCYFTELTLKRITSTGNS